ncbi:conserved domain protein [Trichinella spiralis]|uniref:hypothetical protein n=1 Tax=Trichinella spiralis TaxID=6334 RepID=UPI0001EFCC19|nr:conserved domain protein [Trichinella spiralis]
MLVCPEREWPDAEVSSQVTEGIGLSVHPSPALSFLAEFLKTCTSGQQLCYVKIRRIK